MVVIILQVTRGVASTTHRRVHKWSRPLHGYAFKKKCIQVFSDYTIRLIARLNMLRGYTCLCALCWLHAWGGMNRCNLSTVCVCDLPMTEVGEHHGVEGMPTIKM